MEEKDEVLEYMVNKEWTKESKIEGKLYLFRMAQESIKSDKLQNKIGGVLIINQVIEQLLREIIIASLSYVRAEIWPTNIELNIQTSKATFGKLIEYFKKFAIKKYNREVLIKDLEELNINRNKLVHNLFDIKDESNLKKELEKYEEISDELIQLLFEYYNAISEELFDLDDRVEFESFI